MMIFCSRKHNSICRSIFLYLACFSIFIPNAFSSSKSESEKKMDTYCDSQANAIDRGEREKLLMELTQAKKISAKWAVIDKISASLKSEKEKVKDGNPEVIGRKYIPIEHRIGLLEENILKERKSLESNFGRREYANKCSAIRDSILDADRTNLAICPTRWVLKVLDGLCPGQKFAESYYREPEEENNGDEDGRSGIVPAIREEGWPVPSSDKNRTQESQEKYIYIPGA